jgi:subtilisin family serine protease
MIILITSCAAPPLLPQLTPIALPTAQIARYPSSDDYHYMHVYSEPPVYNPNSEDLFQIDLRSANLKGLDLSGSKADLLHALFDSQTKWPPADKMPIDFDWQKIMELGKDPGLGVRALHEQGITGKGVNIAIIDQPLIIDHVEYPDRIRLYEEIQIIPGTPSQMHGPAVTSIAVGKTAGVAPEANLYYIATWMFDPKDQNKKLTYTFYAQAIRRIIEINKNLPADQKIRVISMSVGSNPSATDYDAFISAIEEAKADGIFAIHVSLEDIYGWRYIGLGRDPLSNPNDFQSYKPAAWWEQDFYNKGVPTDTLLIPMDARTTASPTGKEDYVFYAQGGMSWTVPYLAGIYALAVQVKPDITPEAFWETALQTGRTIQIQHDGKDYKFGVILNPQALIKAIKNK